MIPATAVEYTKDELQRGAALQAAITAMCGAPESEVTRAAKAFLAFLKGEADGQDPT